MGMQVCTNEQCKQPFSVQEISLAMPGTKEREEIVCPHCKTTVATVVSNGFFRTSPLTPKQFEEWKK